MRIPYALATGAIRFCAVLHIPIDAHKQFRKHWFTIALCGFVKYNGMNAEKLALAVIRFEYLMLKRLVFRAENLYARALEHSSAMCVQ